MATMRSGSSGGPTALSPPRETAFAGRIKKNIVVTVRVEKWKVEKWKDEFPTR